MRLALGIVALLAAGPAFAQGEPRAIDGDTISYRRVVYRIYGVDAAETQNFLCPVGPRRDAERTAGERAAERTRQLAAEGVRFRGIGKDARGRTLAVVTHRPSGRSVADILITEELGVPNFGEKRTCRF
jgi:endonuclease YncB( thermonuclease family)